MIVRDRDRKNTIQLLKHLFNVTNEKWWMNHLYNQLHPDGEKCPSCGAALFGVAAHKFRNGETSWCSGCSVRFNWTEGTPLHNSRMSAKQLVAVVTGAQLGLSSKEMSEFSGLTVEAVRKHTIDASNFFQLLNHKEDHGGH